MTEDVAVPGLPPQLVQQWRELARCFAATSCRLDRELHDQHGLGMSEFEILDRLGESDHGKARMQDLGEEVHLSQSALSRAVARLEREGLVCRALCELDRRGVFVSITEAGRTRWLAARPTQRAVLAETFDTIRHGVLDRESSTAS